MAVLALAAGMSTSFVSCVDTEEPDSIVTLRDAKAKEILQEAEVQAAIAALKNAEAEYKLAEKAKLAAEADYKKWEAAIKEQEAIVKKAEATRDAAAATAETDAKTEEAKLKAEAAVADAKAALEQSNEAYQEAIVIYKKKLAQFKVEGENNELKKLLDDWELAQKNLVDAQNDLADAVAGYDAINLVKLINDKQLAYDLAVANKTKFENLVKLKDYKAFADEWKQLDDEITKNKLKENQLTEEIKKLDLAITDLTTEKTNMENEFSKPLTDYKDELVIPTYEISNQTLVDLLVKDEKDYLESNPGGSYFGDYVLVAKDKKFVPKAAYKRSEIASKTAAIRTAIQAYANDLDYAKNNAQNIVDKLTSEAATLKTEIETAETGEKAVWTKAITALASTETTKDNVADRKTDIQIASKALFGQYLEDGEGGKEEFYAYNASFYTDYEAQLIEKYGKTLTEKYLQHSTGKFFAWKRAQKALDDDAQVLSIYTVANGLVSAQENKLGTINAEIKAYNDKVAELTVAEAVAKTTDEKYLKVVADIAEKNATKTAKSTEKTAIATPNANCETLKTLISPFIDATEITGQTGYAIANYDEYYTRAVATLDEKIATAKFDLDQAIAYKTAYEAKDYAKVKETQAATLKAKAEAVKTKQEAADKAQKAYEYQKAFYEEKQSK